MKRASEQVTDSLLQRLLQETRGVAADQIHKIVNRFREVITYTPTIGVCGKTGTGKSRLCNALFGADVAPVDDVEACTREPQRIHVRVSDAHNIELVDMPGVGESDERDTEYAGLYKALLPELDLILWVLKADDRALSIDKHFYKTILKPVAGRTPILFVINQVDKIAPNEEWDRIKHQPSKKQVENIGRKEGTVKRAFDVPWSHVVPVSAVEKYNLTALIHHMVRVLPDEKKVSIVREAVADTVSDETAAEAKRGVLKSMIDYAKKVVGAAAVVAVSAVITLIVDRLLDRLSSPKFERMTQ